MPAGKFSAIQTQTSAKKYMHTIRTSTYTYVPEQTASGAMLCCVPTSHLAEQILATSALQHLVAKMLLLLVPWQLALPLTAQHSAGLFCCAAPVLELPTLQHHADE